METQPNFEFLCRVCAANTKGRHSVAECVYIFKTPALKDRIEKHLYLTISEDDPLPKVLCKTCFRQVEATASLSKIARHTQRVFQDFLISFKPKPQMDVNYENYVDASEYTPISLTAKDIDRSAEQSPAKVIATPPTPTPAPPPPPPPPPYQQPSSNLNKDEVIVNVSVADPLTRETQQKMIKASQKRQSLLDIRFTPKSIAQRAFTSTPKQLEGTTTASTATNTTGTANVNTGTNTTSNKKPSPPGVINFFHGHPQQVTTFTSGGYVIGRVGAENDATTTTANPAATVTASASTATTTISAAVDPTPVNLNKNASNDSNIIQQKRRNLKSAIKNIKASNSGQVSLLKVSRKASQSAQPQLQSQPQQQAQAVQLSLISDTDAQVEELPDRIIIAAAKKQKQQEQAAKKKKKEAEAPIQAENRPSINQDTQQNKPGITEEIKLGKVIKDPDLLKLILKALKWPVDHKTMDTQMARLKSSKFTDIMSDPNLLQDTDLTQLLGPYLAPVLLAAHALQQQQMAMAAAAALAQQQIAARPVTRPAEIPAVELARAMPYKLPAETSVQLVPASPEEEDATKSSSSTQSLKRDSTQIPAKSAPVKKMRKSATPKARDSSSIVISDEEDASIATTTSRQSSKSSASTFPVDIDPSFLSQFAIFSAAGDSSNEALLALLQRQRAALNRLQRTDRRRRSSSIVTGPASGGELAFEEDDIVLMEQGGQASSEIPLTENATNLLTSAAAASTSLATVQPDVQGFSLPPQVSMPIITRPIIKRRKTVIQASPARTNLSVNSQKTVSSVSSVATATVTTPKVSTTTSTEAVLPPMPPLQKKPPEATTTTDRVRAMATQVPSSIITTATQVPSNTSSNATINSGSKSNSVTSTASTLDTAPAKTHTKKTQSSKSTLGQQLLEAIGLQKVQSSSSNDGSKSTGDSVQQIRSALKKSLKQAQEQQKQQQRKHEELIIQDADSTTKNIKEVREVLVEGKAKSSTSPSIIELDVEDQIDKIALVVQNKTDCHDERKEKDKKSVVKVPEMKRRTLIPTSRAGRKASTYLMDIRKDNIELNTIEEDKELSEKEKEEVKGDDNEELNISTSSKESLPRKRGRKRKEEKDIDAKDKQDIKKEDHSQERSGRGRTSTTNIRKVVFDDQDSDSDEASEKNEPEPPTAENNNTTSNTRPTRVSKTMSKYYKGPNKPPSASRRSMSTRMTRNRN